MSGFYNTHIHTFCGDKDVPARFLPLFLVKILSTKVGYSVITTVMKWLSPISKNDSFDRYVQFVTIGKLGSQKAIFENCFSQYPGDTKFIILPMDMAYMGAGSVPRDYSKQLTELRDLRNAYPNNVIPFVHIDCRRNNCVDLFKQAIEEWGFKGLKLYPPLGTFPYDKRYYPIYEYCQSNNLPVISHCTDGNPVYFKGSQDDLIQLLQGCSMPVDYSSKNNKALCAYFTHPLGYKQVMDDFPNLKICLAHYGRGNAETNDIGGLDWDDIIKQMMLTYPNLYVDCAYSMYNEDWWASVKDQLTTNQQLREHFLFGSDFYLVEVETTEKEFDIKFRAYIGEDLFQQIAVTNPMKFLGQ